MESPYPSKSRFYSITLQARQVVFAFTYDLAKARLTPTPGIAALDFASPAVPEPSPWAMMILGFAGLGLAGYRRSRKGAAFAA
jgi:hypothetical protein